jgi:hypothetical protein
VTWNNTLAKAPFGSAHRTLYDAVLRMSDAICWYVVDPMNSAISRTRVQVRLEPAARLDLGR